MIDLRYFKRFRMELDLGAPLPPVPPLPDGYFWLPWDDSLLASHARAKYASFHAEIDSQVFPSLGSELDYRALIDGAGFRLDEFEDASRQVRRTWPANLLGSVQALRHRQQRQRLRAHASEGLFMLQNALRFWLAYRSGALRYGIFTASRPDSELTCSGHVSTLGQTPAMGRTFLA